MCRPVEDDVVLDDFWLGTQWTLQFQFSPEEYVCSEMIMNQNIEATYFDGIKSKLAKVHTLLYPEISVAAYNARKHAQMYTKSHITSTILVDRCKSVCRGLRSGGVTGDFVPCP